MITQAQVDGGLAIGKHVITFGAGAVMTFGLMSATNSQDLVTDFDHIFNGIKEISIGLGPLIAAGMAWWAQNKTTLQSRVQSVKAADPAALVQAVQAVAPVVLRDAVAEQPGVKAVIVTTQAMAQASPSPKVQTLKQE